MKNADLALRRAIDAIQCLADPSPPWQDILQSARSLIGGDGATFVVFEGSQLATFESAGNDPAAVHAYLTHFSALDISLRPGCPPSPGTWIDTESLLSPWERGRNAYYVDFMCRYRVRQMLAFVVEGSPERAAALTMQREVADPRSAKQVATRPITRYAKAVVRAAARRREAASQWMDVAEAAIGAFGDAGLLVNGRAVLLRASANAAPMLDGALGLRVREGRLWHPARACEQRCRMHCSRCNKVASQPACQSPETAARSVGSNWRAPIPNCAWQ